MTTLPHSGDGHVPNIPEYIDAFGVICVELGHHFGSADVSLHHLPAGVVFVLGSELWEIPWPDPFDSKAQAGLPDDACGELKLKR